MKELEQRTLSVIFCDDIRMEVGNKTTIVGAYHGTMDIAAKLPLTLPQLCASVVIKAPKGMEFQKLHLRLFKDEVLLTELVIPEDALQQVAANTAKDPDCKGSYFSAYLNVQPFTIDGPCRLQVIAETESEPLFDSSLRISTNINPSVNSGN